MQEKLGGNKGPVILYSFCPQQNTQPDLPCRILLTGNLLQDEIRKAVVRGLAQVQGRQRCKNQPPHTHQGVQKAKGFLQEQGSPARAEQAMPAAGSGQHRDRQALPMCCPCRSGSSCLAGRQDAVLVVSTVPLTIETTSFTSEWQQTVGRGESSAGGDLAARRVTAHPRGGSGAALIGDPRANTPGR